MNSRWKILAIAPILALGACASAPLPEFSPRRSLSSALDVSCIGPESADTFVIYLHGMDSATPSLQELGNRLILQEIAKAKNIRFALPRAPMQCPTQPGSLCWGWKFDSTEISSVLPLMMDSRLACFGSEKPFSMLGFSNGGYFLTRWYSEGISPTRVPRPIALIASGSGQGRIPAGVTDLSKNPRFTLMIGQQDSFNFDPAETLFHQLQARKAPVQLIEFQGTHTLPEDSLLKALQN